MKYLTINKHWDLVEEYNLDKILYLLIERPVRISNFNDFIWTNNKYQLHRKYDFPSVVSKDGYLVWYYKSAPHRKNNKPAIIYANGCKEYLS